MSGGTSSGLVQTTLVGARVATGKNSTTGRLTELLFTPPYLRTSDNKLISAKLEIPCLVNIYGRTDPDHYRLVVWGGRADLFAKNLGKGKEMHWIVSPRSYWANQYYSDGAIILDRNGQPKTVRQMNFTVQDFAWGADSMRTLYEEMTTGIATGEGFRPQNWNVEGHADNQLWKTLLASRKVTFYLGGDRYGFAKVRFPKEGGIVLLGDCTGAAIRAAGGEQNFVTQCQAAGRCIQVAAGALPAPVTQAAGAPIAPVASPPAQTMVANPNVPLTTQVAQALDPGAAVIPTNPPIVPAETVIAPVIPVIPVQPAQAAVIPVQPDADVAGAV